MSELKLTTPSTPVQPAPAPVTPHRLPPLESAYTTRCGSYHAINQDAVARAEGRFYAVADGVGGGAFGEVASRVLVEHCADPSLNPADPQSLCRHVQRADAVVQRAIDARSPGSVGAATLVSAWLHGDGGYLVHVGDARASCLRFSGGRARLETLTKDQTYGEMGESPPPGGSADDPARMVGVGAVGNPPATAFELGQGDILLLSSDGLHRYAPAVGIEQIATQWLADKLPLQTLAERLETLALGHHSPDDITILLLRRNAPAAALPKKLRWGAFGLLLAGLGLAVGSGIERLLKPAPPPESRRVAATATAPPGLDCAFVHLVDAALSIEAAPPVCSASPPALNPLFPAAALPLDCPPPPPASMLALPPAPH